MTRLVRALLRDRAGAAGLLIIVLASGIALAGPWIAPYPDDAFDTNILVRLEPPSTAHWMGTDDFGRDVLSRVILGTGNALSVALGVVAASVAIGVPLGLWAGYWGGVLGNAIMRVTDIFLAVPSLILAIALAQLLHAGIGGAILALTLSYWPHFCRSIYAETKAAKTATFVEALGIAGSEREPHHLSAHSTEYGLTHHRPQHSWHGLHHNDGCCSRLSWRRRSASDPGLGCGDCRQPRSFARSLVAGRLSGFGDLSVRPRFQPSR